MWVWKEVIEAQALSCCFSYNSSNTCVGISFFSSSHSSFLVWRVMCNLLYDHSQFAMACLQRHTFTYEYAHLLLTAVKSKLVIASTHAHRWTLSLSQKLLVIVTTADELRCSHCCSWQLRILGKYDDIKVKSKSKTKNVDKAKKNTKTKERDTKRLWWCMMLTRTQDEFLVLISFIASISFINTHINANKTTESRYIHILKDRFCVLRAHLCLRARESTSLRIRERLN